MKPPSTVPKELVIKVEDRLLETYIKAEAIWQRQFELPRLQFDLQSTCGGRAYYRDSQIRLNPVLLFENEMDFIEQVVPHEVAHLLTFTLHTGHTRLMPHGHEWKFVMSAFGLKPIRCHNYDVTNAQVRRERRFTYSCKCRTIDESAHTHFKLQRGEYWPLRCSLCGATFRFLSERKIAVADSAVALVQNPVNKL